MGQTRDRGRDVTRRTYYSFWLDCPAMLPLTKPMFPLRTGIAVQARAARRTDNVNQPRAKRERHVNDEARDWLAAADAAPPTECAKKARGRADTARVETRLP